jgi:hypothetical protein
MPRPSATLPTIAGIAGVISVAKIGQAMSGLALA